MALQDFIEALKDPKSPEHHAMVQHVCSLGKISRREMSTNYPQWDENDAIFRSRRKIDKEDRNAEREGKPKKLNIPLTFAQIMTFVAFNVTTITQNRRFFELEATGTEDMPLKEPLELLLERDLRRNTWNAFLVQFFLDIGRFSIGVGKVCYHEDYRYMRIQNETEVEGPFGQSVTQTTSAYTQIPVFVGNKIYPISPYRFLPDTRLPLTRYQDGEFCGSEDMISMSALRGMGDAYFNLDKIPKMQETEYKARKGTSRIDDMPVIRSPDTEDSWGEKGTMMQSGPVLRTEMDMEIIPKDFKYGEGKTMGKEPFPIRFHCELANDKTIIRFEEAYYLHGKYPYFMGQYSPDQHQCVNESLAEVCEQLAGLNTYKWNAHITSLKNANESKYIVDPAIIDMKTLESRSPYIRMRKDGAFLGVDKGIKQFTTVDITNNIVADSAGIKDLLESITGLSGQMQGQYSQGRRSATQDRVVAQGASARGKVGLAAQWDTAFECLGKQLIANNRQEMDFETFSRVMGKRTWPVNPNAAPPVDPMTGMPMVDPMTGMPVTVNYTSEEVFEMFKADPVSIAMSEDFFVFDGTNPSEKAFLAQSLQEIFMEIAANPQMAAVLGYGPEQLRELFNQIYILRGVTPPLLPSPTQAQPPPAQAPNLSVLPDPADATASLP